MEGLRIWHAVNTPWCDEKTIDNYIEEYKRAIDLYNDE